MQSPNKNKILNITNGEYFNKYFLSKFGGEAVPLCEAMMDGMTVSDIYSDAFVGIRATELGVGMDEYRSKMNVFNSLNMEPDRYSELRLWFGEDTFCQMNLLMLLAYLEQIGYSGKVILNIIDDETFDIIEDNIYVDLGRYKKLYEEVLISKLGVSDTGVISKKAVELYFDYHSNNGRLARLVKENSDKGDMTIIRVLLENSKEYGLSDIQAKGLIEKYRT